MNGAVIENVSNRKLFYILSSLFLAQAAFFLVGAWFAPAPTATMDFEMRTCKDPSKGASGKWFQNRPNRCDEIELDQHTPMGSSEENSFDMREIVFVAQMPHTRGNVQLEYSPWFQFILGILHVKVEYSEYFKYIPSAQLMLEVRMGYRDHADDVTKWHEYIATNVTRTLNCHIQEDQKSPGNAYDCEVLDLFELGSSQHPFYLLNIRIPISQVACKYNPASVNCQIGKITELHVIEIHQNGGFTLVWLWLKTLLAPVLVAVVYWYWNRVTLLARKPLLLEKAIMALGTSMAVLDFPFEWFSLYFQVPFLLLLGDIRQGLFYCILFSFWLIFAGEHLIDDTTRNNILSYRFNLLFICTASAALLIYDLCERGMQMRDPFHSVWSTETGTAVAYVSIYVASICTLLYFGFLIYKICKVWTTIKQKRAAQLYRNCENRRLKVEGIIYRFKFLMLFTLVCAGLTILSYSMKQHGEAQLHSDEPTEGVLTHSTSAFFTGTFGMWNIYVLLLLAMYAPSHKDYSTAGELVDESEGLMDGSTESNVLTTFLKPSTD